jgi:hypothetical protein
MLVEEGFEEIGELELDRIERTVLLLRRWQKLSMTGTSPALKDDSDDKDSRDEIKVPTGER